jgi:uncharacterized membrane protein YjjP (DUF1212 family)
MQGRGAGGGRFSPAPTAAPMITAETDTRIAFLSALARALARFGEDSDTMERDLVGCAARLGLPGQFYATPTMVMASFGSDALPRTILLRIHEGNIDLEALDRVNDVRKGVMSGEKTAPQALAELNLIAAAPVRFPWWVRVLASGLGAGSFAIFLGGEWQAFLAAVPVGLVVGAIVLASQRYARLQLLAELLGAFAAAATTLAVGHVIRHFSLPSVALAGLILLLPGLAITTGVSELAARQLSSGTARLAGATVSLVNLGVGSFLGFAVVARLDWVPRTLAVASDPSLAAVLVAVVATSVALLVSTNARTRDWPLTLVAVVVALAGARLGAWLFGATLGVVVAAFALGVCANGYARLRQRPAALVLIPGLAVLVPGALGLRGVSEFLRSAAGGVNVLVSVVIIAAGLVVGLLVADALLPARGADKPVAEAG